MIRLALVLITCTVFTACMTEADRALWQETVETVRGKPSAVVAEAPKASGEAKEIKTAEAGKEKDKVSDESSAKALPPADKAN